MADNTRCHAHYSLFNRFNCPSHDHPSPKRRFIMPENPYDRPCHQIMRLLPSFHRHHWGCTSTPTPTEANQAQCHDNMAPSSLHGSEDSNGRVDELISILSAMKMSESRGASYDPAGKFTYHAERLHGEQLLDGEQPYDDHAKKENASLVDETCRAKMMDWHTKVSGCCSLLWYLYRWYPSLNTYSPSCYITAPMIRWSTTLRSTEA